MPVQTAARERATITKDALDTCLYRPLEQFGLQFDRLSPFGSWPDRMDVAATENGAVSYLQEISSIQVGATAFFVSFSCLRDGESEPGSILSNQQGNMSYMFYAPLSSDGSAFHALVAPKQEILKYLDKLGYTRMVLGMRDTLIRKTGKTGIFQSVDADIWFYFNAEKASKPISMGFNATLLSKLATAEFVYQDGVLSGHWGTQKI